MDTTKKFKWGLPISIIIVLVVMIGAFSWWQETKASKETIKMGAVLPFTGSSGITGESSKNGLELAMEEINKSGGVNNKKIEILYEDSQTKTEVGLTAFQKLKSVNNIKTAFTSVSGVALAISPVANENKIIQMDVVSAAPKYSSPDDFTFRTGVSSYFFASKMTDTLLSNDIKEVALLHVNNDYGLGYKDVFTKDYEGRGGKIIDVETYNQGDTDFKTQITKIKQYSPEAFLMISLQKETPLLLKQMDQLNFNVPIYADVYAAELPDNLTAKVSAGMIYLKPAIDSGNLSNAVAKRFKENYLAKYGKEPDFIAAQAYDGLCLVVEAMKKCDSPENAECIKEQLYSIKNYQGAIGSDLSFDSNGDIVDRPLELKTIKNGQFVPYK